ncbi:hypothetical protein A2U01_0066752 [Trifolium medium]|uniref:Uncharacterized protein n=1 Tax=Trifolium medium TaxID=97028 RepID=A0A392S992_9FABA|nr:hypothetical protein [Trifolium medium]
MPSQNIQNIDNEYCCKLDDALLPLDRPPVTLYMLDIAFESMKQKTGLFMSLLRRAGQGGARCRL